MEKEYNSTKADSSPTKQKEFGRSLLGKKDKKYKELQRKDYKNRKKVNNN